MARVGGSVAMHSRRALGCAALLVIWPCAAATTVATAGAQEPVLHRVTYRVTAAEPTDAKIYYRDVDPPNWADYSHNPYLFSPEVDVTLGPDKGWVLEVMLAEPDRWAMVAVTQDVSRAQGIMHCELAVDGVVVRSADGPKGALCSVRPW
jgi:hypothetical protein